MTANKDKVDMFARAADAACKFLKEFNWNEYQGERIIMRETLKQQSGL